MDIAKINIENTYKQLRKQKKNFDETNISIADAIQLVVRDELGDLLCPPNSASRSSAGRRRRRVAPRDVGARQPGVQCGVGSTS